MSSVDLQTQNEILRLGGFDSFVILLNVKTRSPNY